VKTLKKDVMIVAWLHDVADHKYDFNGNLNTKVFDFLNDLTNHDEEKTRYYMNIIERISFSKENKCILMKQELDWMEVIGEKGCYVRNIVSDADKLEALGKSGLVRCIEYNRERYLEEHKVEVSNEELISEVRGHAKDKLLRLKDFFIRTEPGKKYAMVLHNELVNELGKMEEFIDEV